MRLTATTINIFAIITLVGFSLLGWGLMEWLLDRSLLAVINIGWHWSYQLLIGTVFGLFTAWIAWIIISSKLLTPVRERFSKLFQDLEINTFQVFFISFAAGVGEEVLFRAFLQEFIDGLLGGSLLFLLDQLGSSMETWMPIVVQHSAVWLTSFLFILLHGYISFKRRRINYYGAYMVLLSAGLGYLYLYVGLISAMMAHFTIDVVLLSGLLDEELEEVTPVDSEEAELLDEL